MSCCEGKLKVSVSPDCKIQIDSDCACNPTATLFFDCITKVENGRIYLGGGIYGTKIICVDQFEDFTTTSELVDYIYGLQTVCSSTSKKLKNGIQYLPMCHKASNTETVIKICVDNGETTITDPINGEITELELAQNYCQQCEEEVEEKKIYIEEIERKDPDNIKELLAISVYRDNQTGEACYFLTTDENLENPLNINDYEMGNYVGMPPVAKEKTTGKVAVDVCGELIGTYADLLAALVASPEFVMPDGSAPDGLIGLEVVAKYKGQLCAGVTTTGQGGTLGDGTNHPIVSISGGGSYCTKHEYTDADCDGKAANCLDLTTVVNFPDGHGFKVVGVGVVCDTDDADASV